MRTSIEIKSIMKYIKGHGNQQRKLLISFTQRANAKSRCKFQWHGKKENG